MGGRLARVGESAQLTPLSAVDCLGLKPLAGHSLVALPKADLKGVVDREFGFSME